MEKNDAFQECQTVNFLAVWLAALITLVACSSANGEIESGADSITNIIWQWESVTDKPSGETTTVPDPENYTLIFRNDGTSSGKVDCNEISGTYTQEGGFFLTLGPSTMALCEEDSLDQLYLDLLNGVVAGGPAGDDRFALEWGAGEKRLEFSNGGAAQVSIRINQVKWFDRLLRFRLIARRWLLLFAPISLLVECLPSLVHAIDA